MTLTESMDEIQAMIERCYYERDKIALADAWNAMEAMKNIKKAESVEEAVEILQEYLSEVEV